MDSLILAVDTQRANQLRCAKQWETMSNNNKSIITRLEPGAITPSPFQIFDTDSSLEIDVTWIHALFCLFI